MGSDPIETPVDRRLTRRHVLAGGLATVVGVVGLSALGMGPASAVPPSERDLVRPTSGEGSYYRTPDGANIYYDDQGRGEVVVLLHGGLMDHQSWGNQIPVLSRHARVISPDMRGHGRSGDTAEPYSYAQFADDVAGLLASLGIERATIVGFSDGGVTALMIAMRHRELVEKLVLIGAYYENDPAAAEYYSTLTPEEIWPLLGEGTAFTEVVLKAKAQYDTEDAWKAFFAKAVNDFWTREPNIPLSDIATITATTLVLYSENDAFYPVTVAETLAATIPDARLEILPGAPHTAPQEDPKAVNKAILAFLREKE